MNNSGADATTCSLSFPTNIRLKIDQIENYASPTNSSDFRKSASAILAERINSLKTKDENAAAGLAQTAASLFPASSILVSLKNELKLKPWDGLSEANAAIASGKLSEASQIKETASEKFGTHPQFIGFSRLLDDKKSSIEFIKLHSKDTHEQLLNAVRDMITAKAKEAAKNDTSTT